MTIIQNEFTGSRLIGAITPLGEIGPKHHGIVLGTSMENNKVYVAESMIHGYQITEADGFIERYKGNDKIQVCPNNGPFSNVEVAKRALHEINSGCNGKYDLVTNNCESFSNRAMYGNSVSTQVINTILGVIVLVGCVWIIKEIKKG